MRNLKPTKGDKKEVREETHLTRPPRLEGVVQNRGIKPIRKPKKKRLKQRVHKPQADSELQRRQYHLRSKKH